MIDPKTKGEWQDAIDAAHFYLALHSARLYGLVTGGPEINVDRCVDLIERGRRRGVVPAKDSVERGVRELLRCK